METALEVVRIILEYFGWEGNEIEVSHYRFMLGLLRLNLRAFYCGDELEVITSFSVLH